MSAAPKAPTTIPTQELDNEDGEDSAGELEQPIWGGRPRDSSKEHEHSVQKVKVY